MFSSKDLVLKHVSRSAFAILSGLIVILPVQVVAAPSLQPRTMMTFGDPKAGHVDLAIARTGKALRAIELVTHRVGAPGSRLSLSVDRGRRLLSVILTDRQCHFDDSGSLCRVTVGRTDRSFRPLVAAIRTGRSARVTVENAGNMAMDTVAPLRAVAAELER